MCEFFTPRISSRITCFLHYGIMKQTRNTEKLSPAQLEQSLVSKYVFENCNGKSLILQTFELSHERTSTINRKKFPTFTLFMKNYRFIGATIQIWTDSRMYKILLIFNIPAHRFHDGNSWSLRRILSVSMDNPVETVDLIEKNRNVPNPDKSGRLFQCSSPPLSQKWPWRLSAGFV